MMAFAPASGPISVRQLVELLSRLDDQEGPVGVLLFDRSGLITLQAASNVDIRHADPGDLEAPEPPVILIVAGEPPDGIPAEPRRAKSRNEPDVPAR